MHIALFTIVIVFVIVIKAVMAVGVRVNRAVEVHVEVFVHGAIVHYLAAAASRLISGSAMSETSACAVPAMRSAIAWFFSARNF